MKINLQSVLSQNITLLYDSLELQAIDSSKLKTLRDGQALMMDTPETIVAVYPAESLFIQMGDKRTRITLQQQVENIGSVPLWEIAARCNQLVTKSTLIAYGFNFDLVAVAADGDAHKTLLEMFVPDCERVNRALAGQLVSFTPRLAFQREQTRYDLILEPLDVQHIKAHLNAHFQSEGITLPSQEQLQAAFYAEYDYLIAMLPRLFEES